MSRIREKHSLAVRWLHWINFPLLAMMMWSGLLIYWASPVYGIWIGGHKLISFFPLSVFKALHVRQRLAEGMAHHFSFAWLFAVNGALYAIYLVLSGEWREIAPKRGGLRRAAQVLAHDLHLRKEKPSAGKYNDAQRLAYSAVIAMAAGCLLSGLAILKPVQLSWLTWLLGGYQAARFEHFWLTMGMLSFFVVHLLQVARAGWANFVSMFAGCELEK